MLDTKVEANSFCSVEEYTKLVAEVTASEVEDEVAVMYSKVLLP
jgi:hypothetical protein